MVHTITLKELRPALPHVIEDIDSKLDRYIVIKRGKPVAMMMSVDDYESLIETLDILSDKEAVKRIKQAKEQIAKGQTILLEELRRKIEHVQG